MAPGPDHPDTLGSRNNLASAYESAGRQDEALLVHERRTIQSALRGVCSEFTGQVARVRIISAQVRNSPGEIELRPKLENAFAEAQAAYARMCITAESLSTQEAARYVIHYAYWTSQNALTGGSAYDESWRQLVSANVRLFFEVRRELGLKNPEQVFRDPTGGLQVPGAQMDGSPS